MKVPSAQAANKNTFTILHTNQVLKVDKTKINFCKYPIFASSFKQISVSIELQDYFTEAQRKEFHLLKIKSGTTPMPCLEKFGTDKLFTVKAVENGEEVSQLQVPMKADESLQIYVRTNIPELESSMDINGTLSLQLDDFTPLVLPIISRGEVPQIVCLKEMESVRTGAKIIKIPSKGIMKIPFKNCSNINFFFQIRLIGKDIDTPDSDGVRINVIPNVGSLNAPVKPFEEPKGKDTIIKVEANSAFCVTLAMELLKNENPIRIARRLLVLQVQGTKLLFPFPLEVIISD